MCRVTAQVGHDRGEKTTEGEDEKKEDEKKEEKGKKEDEKKEDEKTFVFQ